MGTEHVLLGLVAEDTLSKHGYLNSGLTLEAARTAVEASFGKKRALSTNDAIPFSREVRKNFELATSVSALQAGFLACLLCTLSCCAVLC